jgi:hypothetical protein
MVMGMSASEVFGAQQGREHVDRHADGGGDVDDGEDHRSDPPEQDGEDGEQGEHRHPNRDIDKVHRTAPDSGAVPISRLPIKVRRLGLGAAIKER